MLFFAAEESAGSSDIMSLGEESGNVAKIGETEFATLEEAVAASVDGDTIELLKNASGTGIGVWAADAKSITIDLGGFTYTCTGSGEGSSGTKNQAFHFEKGNTITLKNGTIACEAESGIKMMIQSYCALTLTDLTVDGTNIESGNYGMTYFETGYQVVCSNSGAVTINGNTSIKAPAQPNAYALVANWWVGSYGDGTQITVDTTGTIGNAIMTVDSGDDASSLTTLTITNANIPGGVTVEGSIPIEKLGYDYVASIAGTDKVTYYATLAEAVAASADGDTVNLLMDASGEGIAVWAADAKSIIIDFGGFTYTCTGPAVGSEGTVSQAFHFEMGNTIVLENGTVTSTDVETSGIKMLVQNYSELTLDKMTLDGTNIGSGRYTLSNNCGLVWIRNTEIIAPENGIAFDVCGYASYEEVLVLVLDSSTIIGKIEVSSDGGDHKLVLGLGEGDYTKAFLSIVSGFDSAVIARSEGVTIKMTDGYAWNSENELVVATAKVVDDSSAVYYATLAEAVAASADGDTVNLLMDASGEGIAVWADDAKSIIIDFGTFTYTCTGPAVGSEGTVSQAFHFEMGNTIVLMNGTVTSTDVETSGIKMLVQNYSNLFLESMVLDGTNLGSERYTLSNNCGLVWIKDTKITAPTNGVAFDVCGFADYQLVWVTVVNSEINGTIEISSDGGDHVLILILGEGEYSEASLSITGGFDQVGILRAEGVAISVTEGYAWDSNNILVRASAKIGDAYYATLAEAIDAAEDGETVTLCRDTAESGIIVPEGSGTITVDFDGYAYHWAGSPGAETQAFCFGEGNTVTLMNGTIASSWGGIRSLIQSYCALTLVDMVLDGKGLDEGGCTLSVCNGTVGMERTSIVPPAAGGTALGIFADAASDGISVTVKENSAIVGTIEVDSGAAKVDLWLYLLTGDYTEASLSVPGGLETTYITKASDVSVRVEGPYAWNSEDKLVVAAAKVGDKYYATVGEAIENAPAGATMELYTDDGTVEMSHDEAVQAVELGLVLEIRNQAIAVTMSSEAIADIVAGGTDDLVFAVGNADPGSLTPEQREAVKGAAAVLSFELYAGGSAVHDLGEKATVTVDFTPGEGQDADNLYVAFIKDNGAVKRVDYTYKDGKLTFETDHFSCYALMYSAQITYDWDVYLIVVLAFCAVMAVIIAALSRLNTYKPIYTEQ